MKTALITPAYDRDQRLLDLACHQVDRFCPDDIEHIVVVSRQKKAQFKHLESKNRKVLFVEDIIGNWTWRTPIHYRKRELYFYKSYYPVDGWIMQQIIKLAAPDYCSADLLIYLDSDVFLIKPFSSAFFVEGTRVRLLRQPPSEASHSAWHRRAQQLFKLPEQGSQFPDYIGGLVSWRRDNCLSLREDLEQKWQRPWLDVMTRERDFSEYTLYGTYVDGVLGGDSQKHFATNQNLCLSIWKLNTAAEPAEELRQRLRTHHIAVNVQSNIKLPYERYSDAVADAVAYLPNTSLQAT